MVTDEAVPTGAAGKTAASGHEDGAHHVGAVLDDVLVGEHLAALLKDEPYPAGQPASVLMGPLLGFVGLRFGSGLVGLGFLASNLALSLCFLLLRFAFLAESVVVGDRTDRFLRLALDAFDRALDS